MSKIALKPNASGTGVFSLEAPSSNVDRTLTLPDEAGSVLTDVSDIESQVKTATNATGSAPIYACRAWVRFNGDNETIYESGNISSITDLGSVQFRLNFTKNMPDAGYCATTGIAGPRVIQFLLNTHLIGSIDVQIKDESFSPSSMNDVNVAIFR